MERGELHKASSLAILLISCSVLHELALAMAKDTQVDLYRRRITRRQTETQSANRTNGTTLPGQSFCKDNHWTLFRSRCYRVYNTFEYFASANQICKNNGGTLTSVSDKEENNLVQNLIVSNTRYNEAWIGLRYQSESKGYEWVDKTTSKYTNWLFQKPDQEGLCVHIIPGGVWSNTLCNRKLQFVCERAEVVPINEDNETKIIIMVTLPLSCVVIMLVFISYLCFRSHAEINALAVEEKKISQHFVDVVKNSATVDVQNEDIVQQYEKSIKDAAKKNDAMEEHQGRYKERRKRTYSSPNGREKMYKQVTFV